MITIIPRILNGINGRFIFPYTGASPITRAVRPRVLLPFLFDVHNAPWGNKQPSHWLQDVKKIVYWITKDFEYFFWCHSGARNNKDTPWVINLSIKYRNISFAHNLHWSPTILHGSMAVVSCVKFQKDSYRKKKRIRLPKFCKISV